jgi:hypothetical protein
MPGVASTAGRVRTTPLSEFAATVEGAVAAPWRPRNANTIVKILAVIPGRRIHRDVLVGRPWPDADSAVGSTTCARN